MTAMHCKPEFNGCSVADSAVLFQGLKGRYKRPLTSRDLIGLWKEKRYRRNMMFLFAGHSDKPLKSLISMAHEGNHICLHRFSFIYVTNDLREDAYICPINIMNRTTKSAIYVMELTVRGWVPILGSAARNLEWQVFTTYLLIALCVIFHIIFPI